MVFEHDFKRFPELSNSQMQFYYWDSPHKQITDNFSAKVIRVIDGDTVRVKWFERDFDFPVRLSNLAAPEINEVGGRESKKWLENQILRKDVDIILHPSRIERWGRLLADIMHAGMSMSELSVMNGHGIQWEERERGLLPNFLLELEGRL